MDKINKDKLPGYKPVSNAFWDAGEPWHVRPDVYKDKAGKYRWRIIHRNGNILADSGQGYRWERYCWLKANRFAGLYSKYVLPIKGEKK